MTAVDPAAAIADLSPRQFFARWSSIPETETATRREALRLRFRHHTPEWARYCLPATFDSPWNPFHRAALGRRKLHWRDQPTVREAHVAPRGVGKSTLKKADVAHSVAYGLRRFIVVLGAGKDDALSWSAALRRWFGERDAALNGPLWDLYGPFQLSGGAHRFTITCPAGSTTILCKSLSTSVQGENEETHRPDEVVIDDGEDRRKVKNPRIRADWQAKLNGEILKLGDRRRGLVTTWIATISHPDAITARLLKGAPPNAGWNARAWPAIQRWPERADLWAACGRIYTNLTLGPPEVREALARDFYAHNRPEMDRGAALLDPHLLPLFELYLSIWAEGLAAFLAEFQHKARAPGDRLFDSSTFARCRVETHPVHGLLVRAADGREVLLRDCRKRIGRWDPAKGTAGGDFAALAVLLRDRFGYAFVVDAWMRRAPVSQQMAAAWMLGEKWGLRRFSLESNGFQSLIDDVWRPERTRRRDAERYWQLQLALDASTANKEDRLAAMEAPISAGIVQFAEHLPPEAIAQYDDFDGVPNSHHDDFPDAVEGAFSRSGGSPLSMGTERLQ
jgi:hypothetical protein